MLLSLGFLERKYFEPLSVVWKSSVELILACFSRFILGSLSTAFTSLDCRVVSVVSFLPPLRYARFVSVPK
jgi:hypothetical protein